MHASRRQLGLVLPLVAALLAFKSVDVKALVERGNILAQEARMAADHCGGQCHPCGVQINKTHLFTGGSGSHWNYPYDCVVAECPNPCYHGGGENPGGGNEEPLADVLAAVVTAIDEGNALALREIVSRDTRVFVNSNRGAIQASGCDGDAVIATIAVSDHLRQQAFREPTAVRTVLPSLES